MRVGIDAMGGDRAPLEIVRGAVSAAASLNADDSILLIGQQEAIEECLNGISLPANVDIHHTEEVIGMDEKPVEALRAKPDSSLRRMAELHRRNEIDACISAGNTGACVAAAQMRLRRLPGVRRPGIAIIAPTTRGPVAVCDVGANVDCRPDHLHQYAVMGSVYLRSLRGIECPRVGLLSVGVEEGKGNDLVRAARELIKADPNIHFVGNVEGRDLFSGTCDLMVCDGFVGNVMLKLIEGMASSIVQGLLEELTAVLPDQQAALQRAAMSLRQKYDFNDYGGAPLLGVAGIYIICHGDSNHRAIENAVRVAIDLSRRHVNRQITDLLA